MSRDIETAIRDHVVDGAILEEKHEAIFVRWTAAFTLLCKYKIKSVAMVQLRNQFGISEPTAYADLRGAERVFGNSRAYTKEALRYMIIEDLFEDIQGYNNRIKLIEQREKESGEMSRTDLKVWEMCKRMKKDAYNSIGKISNLDKDDEERPDFSKIQPPETVISIPESATKVLEQLLLGGAVDLDNLPLLNNNSELIKNAIIEPINKSK